MVHIFSDPSKRPFVDYAIRSAINQNHYVTFWFNDALDATDENYAKLSKYGNRVIIKFVSNELECYEPAYLAKKTWSTKKQNSYAPYADIVRLNILAKFGGWWIDDDFILLNDPNKIGDDEFIVFSDYSYHPLNHSLGEYPSNYFMGSLSECENSIAKVLLNKCYAIKNTTCSSERRYHTFGPHLMYTNTDLFSVMPPMYAPSICQFDVRKYTETMTEMSWYDIMFIRSVFGLHLTDLQNHKIQNDSILHVLMSSIMSGYINPINMLYKKYHDLHATFFKALYAKASELDALGERQIISLVEFKNIL